jgi:SAM-dependent methyltransferase
MACGPGRHTIPLAKMGFQVTGVDLSSYLMDKARDYSMRERVSVELIQEDMRFYTNKNSFDLALSLYSSFGYFEDHEDNQRVMNCIYKSLKPGGYLVIDLPGQEVLARSFKNTVRKKISEFGHITEYRTVSPDWKRLGLSWKFHRNNQLKRCSFKLWLYSADDIKHILRKAGFSEISLFGDFKLNPYDHNARQLIAFATKG